MAPRRLAPRPEASALADCIVAVVGLVAVTPVAQAAGTSVFAEPGVLTDAAQDVVAEARPDVGA